MKISSWLNTFNATDEMTGSSIGGCVHICSNVPLLQFQYIKVFPICFHICTALFFRRWRSSALDVADLNLDWKSTFEIAASV